MTHKAVIFLADGFEELEALAPADIFRRAGLPVELCRVGDNGSLTATGSHGIRVECNISLSQLEGIDWSIAYYPGGMPGAATLAATPAVVDFARVMAAKGNWNCAICAAPMVLDAAQLLNEVEYTCYPGFEERIRSGKYTGRYIQRSGRILTACGPAAAVDFSLEILRAVGMSTIATQIAKGMQLKRG